MKAERTWEGVVVATTARGTCIKPGNGNSEKAKADFENHPEIVRYYTFELADKSRGYFRFFKIPNIDGLLLDYATPWMNSDDVSRRNFNYLSEKVRLYAPKGNLPDGVEVETIGEMDLTESLADLNYTCYCKGKKEIMGVKK